MLENTEYYEKRVMFGLFNKNNSQIESNKRVKDFVHYLSDDHFTGKNKIIYTIVVRYFRLTNNLISINDFIDSIKNSDDMTEALLYEYQQLFLEFVFGEPIVDVNNLPDGSKGYISNSEFTYALERLRKQTQIDRYGSVLADTMQILTSGKTIQGKVCRGFHAAKEYYDISLTDIDKVGGLDLPTGNIQDESEDIRKEYAEAKHGDGSLFRVMTGIKEVDDLTGGGCPGEMWFIAGFSGEGKTTECINITYNAMLQGKNTLFCTAETLRNQVRRRLISRHSIHPKFNYPKGLPADNIKKGLLSPAEEKIFFDVVDDLTNNKKYGLFKIEQIPNKCTVNYINSLLVKYEHEFFIHVAVWDEIRLAGVARGRQSRREELNDIIMESKQMAVNHKHLDDSRGVLLLAPYQISRANWLEAIKSGTYTKACMSETSEAEKTADLILSHLVVPDRPNEIKAQILKYRDGNDKINEFYLDWISDCCVIKSKEVERVDLLDNNDGDDL